MDSTREQQIRKEYEQKLKAKDKQLKEARAAWAQKEYVINNKLYKMRQLYNETMEILTMNPHSSFKKTGAYNTLGNQGWKNNRNDSDAMLKRRNSDLENTVRKLEKELEHQKSLNRHPRGESDDAQDQESELDITKSPFKFTIVPPLEYFDICTRYKYTSERPTLPKPFYLN